MDNASFLMILLNCPKNLGKERRLKLFEHGDVCEIIDILERDHYFDKRISLVGKKVRVICAIASMSSQDNGFFNGWVELPDGAPEIKIEKGGFTSFTHVRLEKIK